MARSFLPQFKISGQYLNLAVCFVKFLCRRCRDLLVLGLLFTMMQELSNREVD